MSAAGKRHMSKTLPIPGYEGVYEVSDNGKVFSLTRSVRNSYGWVKICQGKELKHKQERNGYLRLSLCKDGRREMVSVHRVVCRAFHGEAPDGMHVNHKNGIKTDNRAENLEWVTPSENVLHSYAVLNRKSIGNMTGKFGAEHNRSVSVESFNLSTGKSIQTFGSMQEAGRNGFSATRICACIKGRASSHKGLGWRRQSE